MSDWCCKTVPGAEPFVRVTLSQDQQKRLVKYCSTRKCGQSAVLAQALAMLAAQDPPNADDVLPMIAELLGLPGTADAASICEAIQLLAEPPGEPLADAPPNPLADAPAALRRLTGPRPAAPPRR